MTDQKLKQVTSFKSAGATLGKEYLLTRSPHHDCLSNGSNDQINSILFYGCETWALLPDSKKGIQPFETKCMRKLLRISYLEHRTNH